MTWKRARKPDQKAERVAAILEAAAALFDQKELADISMRDVAADSGLSKASLYSYFKTKEEVFATLFLKESAVWFELVEPKLRQLRSPDVSQVAEVLTDVLRERQRFARLTVVLASVLERNMSTDFIREFKMKLNKFLGQIVSVLQTVFPEMNPQSGIEFLYQHHSMIAGLWPLTHPSPEVAEVLASEEFQGIIVDFYTLFQSTMERLLLALSQGNR